LTPGYFTDQFAGPIHSV